MVTDQKVRPVSPCFPPLAHSLRRKKKYLHSSWFKLKVNPVLHALQQIFLKLAFLKCDIIIKVDYTCPKESDFSSSQRQSLKGSYMPNPDLSSWGKKKKETKQNPSTYSTACSQIPYLELLECRLKQFTREKGNTNTVHAPLTSTAVK